MIEEKQRLVRLLNEYIDGPGLTVVIGAEHPDPSLRSFSLVASTYEDGRHRHDRRHRSDAHALFAGDRGRRRRGAGGLAHAARSQLGITMADERSLGPGGSIPRRRPIRRTPEAPDRGDRGSVTEMAGAPAANATTLRSPAAQDRRVRQLPQTRRARAARAGRPVGRRSAERAAARRRRLRARADRRSRRGDAAPIARASN